MGFWRTERQAACSTASPKILDKCQLLKGDTANNINCVTINQQGERKESVSARRRRKTGLVMKWGNPFKSIDSLTEEFFFQASFAVVTVAVITQEKVYIPHRLQDIF